VDTDSGTFKYFLKVVPTEYADLKGARMPHKHSQVMAEIWSLCSTMTTGPSLFRTLFVRLITSAFDQLVLAPVSHAAGPPPSKGFVEERSPRPQPRTCGGKAATCTM